MEFKHVSIVVIKISGKSNLTTDTDAVLSYSSVNDRIVINIDGSVISCGATIVVNQLYREAVRIISVRSRQLDGVVVGTHHGAIGQNLVVLIPGEAVAAGRSRSDIGVHHDVVCHSVAHDRIGDQFEDRVRKYGDGVVTICIGFATISGLANGNSIVVCGRIAILGLRCLLIYRVNCARDDLTVAVPCEDLTTGNTTADVSGQGYITAFADGVITLCKVSGNAVDNRIGHYIHNHRVAGSDTE